jgi:hypothetical protein
VCVVVFFSTVVSAFAVRFIVPKIDALNHNAEFTSADEKHWVVGADFWGGKV